MAKEKFIMNLWAIIALLLGILLVASLTYIIVGKYKQAKVERENELMLKGYQYAILQIVAQAEKCEPVNINMGNKSIELLPTNCTRYIPMDSGLSGMDLFGSLGSNGLLG
ncbi:MAG: hypothetical protein MUF61_00915 [archaeon]|nr:hypothetical protein [archaeon]